MTRATPNGHVEPPPTNPPVVRTRVLQVAVFAVIQTAVLFGAAGSLSWPLGWATLGVQFGTLAALSPILLRTRSNLIVEWAAFGERAKRWDLVLAALSGAVGPLVILFVAGLDKRFGWSPELPLSVQIGALFFMSLGYDLFAWAIAANPFFSTAVRIQNDRSHTLVDEGPYRYVRHPGYAGMLVYSLAAPIALGSLWALVPAGLVVCVIVVRTLLEDRTLRAELEGYEAYTGRVRYRLIPRFW